MRAEADYFSEDVAVTQVQHWCSSAAFRRGLQQKSSADVMHYIKAYGMPSSSCLIGRQNLLSWRPLLLNFHSVQLMALSSLVKDTASRIRKSHAAVALLLVIVLVIWLFSGEVFRAQTEAPEPSAKGEEPSAKGEEQPAKGEEPVSTRVETRRLRSQTYAPEQVAQGQLLPIREVEIRSQTSAHVSERNVRLGDRASEGDVLFLLDQERREAQLARAEASLKLSRAELRAGERLLESELMSETDFLRLEAAVAAAKAERELAALQLEYTRIRAPFSGVVDRLPVEEGDLVQLGQAMATLVDVSILELSAYIPQQQVQPLEPGLAVVATLMDGTRLPGTLTYVASRADSSTRSFRVEARIDNPSARRIAGASATISIALAPRQAHRLSPALLVLEDDGQLGIKAVNHEKQVEFMPVEILGFDTSGAWVAGLPDEVELITLGGGFIDVGDSVDPVRTEAP